MPIKFQKLQWGKWLWNPKDTWISMKRFYEPMDVEHSYQVDLTRCNSCAQILDWIAQISKKEWTTAADIGYLVEALNDLIDLQGNFCSGGKEISDGKNDYAIRILEKKQKEDD